MNKIFKVVWSKSKQCYVVVSEMAKNNSGKKRVLATVLAALVATGGMSLGHVDAANNTSGGGNQVPMLLLQLVVVGLTQRMQILISLLQLVTNPMLLARLPLL